MTWLDHQTESQWTTSIADGLDGLFGDAAGLEPLRAALTPRLEPSDPRGEETAAWTVSFPPGTGDRFTAELGVGALDGVDSAAWATVLHYCTAFDILRSFWLDTLLDHLPGPVTRVGVEQVGPNRRVLHGLALDTWALRSIGPEIFQAPEGYAARRFDVAEFFEVEKR